MDAVALLTSVTLQYGVPIEELSRKLKNTRFEPYGRTTNPQIPFATSLADYIFRWLELKFAPTPPAPTPPTTTPLILIRRGGPKDRHRTDRASALSNPAPATPPASPAPTAAPPSSTRKAAWPAAPAATTAAGNHPSPPAAR